jgi:hypothetical protein
MNGAPLTPAEAVASVAWKVSGLEAQGIDRDRAIGRVAANHGILPEKVRWCVASARRISPRLPSAVPLLPSIP